MHSLREFTQSQSHLAPCQVLKRAAPNQGILLDIVLGVVAALVGDFMLNVFGAPGVTGFNIYSVIVMVVGWSSLSLVPLLVAGGSLNRWSGLRVPGECWGSPQSTDCCGIVSSRGWECIKP